jgi:hypothetical protein
MLERTVSMIWEALRINDVIYEQPKRRRRVRSLFVPAGLMRWVAAIGWVLAALAL